MSLILMRQKMFNTTGYKISKMRNSKGQFVKGSQIRLGIQHTEKSRKKMSDSCMGRKSNSGSFKKNQTPWNKGTKGVMKSNSGSFKKGEHTSPNTEFKRGENSGTNNINWKGGITPIKKQIYFSSEYRKILNE